jgi:hypothetical protein
LFDFDWNKTDVALPHEIISQKSQNEKWFSVKNRVFAWSKSGRRVSQVRAEKPNRKSVVAELGTTLEMRKRLLPYVANSLNL